MAGTGAEGAAPAAAGLDRGLTSEEVEERHRRGLGNEEAAPTSRPLGLIIRTNVFTRFNAILGALLAVIIVVGPFQDGLFAIVLVANAVIGIGQELRAKRTLDRLAVLGAPAVRVERDGQVVTVDAAELVMDDVIELERGDQVPVDGIVLDGNPELDESLLTGEANPVPRPAGSEVHSGSFVSSGSGRYRVTQVGSNSFAQALVGEARRFTLARSELNDGVNRFLQLIQWALVPVTVLLVVSQLLLSNLDLADAIRGCVAGVGAMIPEGLVLLTSVAFAVAVIRLGRRRVLVQELAAVEGLARVDVLCVDKTGTLTRGGIDAEGLDELASAEFRFGPDTAAAALGALAAAESHPNATLAAIAVRWPAPEGWVARATVPFSSARRFSAADFGDQGGWVIGAPDVLLPACGVAVEETARLVADAAATGRRVVLLAAADGPVADGQLPTGLTPVAVVRLAEQIREDVQDTLAYFEHEGVVVKVISGDHPATVAYIAATVGVPGADQPVDAGSLSDEELGGLVESCSVFGRVSPRQKRLMIAALQARGRTVAMTGDGVNDVLALKDADIGVAMGSGSAAARGVAQLILLDDSFAALPVIAEGRRVIANVERVANLFLTKTAYATVLAIAVAVAGAAYPLLPRHLTLIDDFSIGIPGFFLALLPNSRRFRPGFVDRVLRFAVPCGVICGAAALTAYFLDYRANLPLVECRTAATAVLVSCGLWVLTMLARPLSGVKVILVAAMAAGFALVVAVPAGRTWFALRFPPAGHVVEAVAAIAVAVVALELVYRQVRQSAGLVDAPATGPPTGDTSRP